MKYFFLILMTAAFVGNAAAQILPPMDKQQNGESGDAAARGLIGIQPDYTADASCLNYENTTGHGFGESVKSAKKADWYRHESETFIDYFTPDEAAVRYTFKNKKYEAFTGDAENHLWFTSVESPALLASDKSLKFEIVGRKAFDFEIAGKIKKRELIKIKVTGETTIGGDWDKTTAFLYVAPDLKNLVVKTELMFPKGGRNCRLGNISFKVADGLFAEFAEYRFRQNEKFLTLPKAADVVQIECGFTPLQSSYFTEKSLLEVLARFVPGAGYKTKWILYQTGTMTLADGTILHWSANGVNSLMLKHNNQERYYILSPEIKK